MNPAKTILSAVTALLFVTLALAFSPKQAPSESSVAGVSEAPVANSPAHAVKSPDKKLGIAATIAVVVNDVRPGTLAAEMNLAPGDFILEVNGKQFFSLAEFQSLVAASEGRHKYRVLRLNESCEKEVFEVQPKQP